MSLNDRTNETIPLSMVGGDLHVDVDQDSSVWPEPWVWVDDNGDDERPALKLTLEEAGKLHDRLGRILAIGSPSDPKAPFVRVFAETLAAAGGQPSPIKAMPYLTIIPTRRPQQKAHTSLGHAKNAVNAKVNYRRGLGCRAQVFEWADAGWKLLWDIPAGTTTMPWNEASA